MSAAEQMTTVVQMETPKSTMGVFTLPCGYLDPDTQDLITEVEVREMRGYEEDMLASKKVPTRQKLSQLLAGCVIRLGEQKASNALARMVQELLIGDRVFLLFAIRRITLGDEFPIREKCPHCAVRSLYMINLATDLEIKKMPDPRKRVFDDVLPSGAKVRFRASSGKDEDRLGRLLTGKGEVDALSQQILMRLEVVNDTAPSLTMVKQMSFRDRQHLRRKFRDVEGGVITLVEYECPSCGEEWKKELNISASGFFFPGDQQEL